MTDKLEQGFNTRKFTESVNTYLGKRVRLQELDTEINGNFLDCSLVYKVSKKDYVAPFEDSDAWNVDHLSDNESIKVSLNFRINMFEEVTNRIKDNLVKDR